MRVSFVQAREMLVGDIYVYLMTDGRDMKPNTASASEGWIWRRINRSVMMGSCVDAAIFLIV